MKNYSLLFKCGTALSLMAEDLTALAASIKFYGLDESNVLSITIINK